MLLLINSSFIPYCSLFDLLHRMFTFFITIYEIFCILIPYLCLDIKPSEYLADFLFVQGEYTHGFLWVVFFVTAGSYLASTYYPNTTLQCFLKSSWSLITISLGVYFSGIPFLSGRKFICMVINYTRCMMIWDDR